MKKMFRQLIVSGKQTHGYNKVSKHTEARKARDRLRNKSFLRLQSPFATHRLPRLGSSDLPMAW
jgi:hypothetical protein